MRSAVWTAPAVWAAAAHSGCAKQGRDWRLVWAATRALDSGQSWNERSVPKSWRSCQLCEVGRPLRLWCNARLMNSPYWYRWPRGHAAALIETGARNVSCARWVKGVATMTQPNPQDRPDAPSFLGIGVLQ